MREVETPLELARRLVATASRLVDEQSERVAQMPPDGELARSARALLETMNLTLKDFCSDLARLEEESQGGP